MATNDILPFALSGSANVLTQTAYAALSARTTGFQSGVARSVELNKVWRQSSFVAAAVAGWVAARGVDVLDNGNLASLIAAIQAAQNAQTEIALTAGVPRTLDATTEANYPTLRLTGFINITTYVVVPATASGWTVINDTTGSADVVVKTPSGAGVVVPRTLATQVVCDGVDVRNVSSGVGVEPGTVVMTARAAADTGYLLCRGQAVNRATYAPLFSAIGTTYGSGNGVTTFNVPDFRGVFPRGHDAGRGLDADRALGSAQEDALQNITGRVSVVTGEIVSVSGAFGLNETVRQNHINAPVTYTDPAIDFDASRVVRTAGETRPKNLAINFQIKF